MTEQRFGVVGVVVIAAGAVLGILAFTVLDWFRSNGDSFGAGPPLAFGDMPHRIDYLRSEFATLGGARYLHFGVSPLYFGWLAWVLLAAAVALAVAAVAPLGRTAAIARIVAAVVALLGLGSTLWAIDYLSYDAAFASRARAAGDQVPTLGLFLRHSSVGAWAALAAFLLVGAGALIGPRRHSTPERPT